MPTHDELGSRAGYWDEFFGTSTNDGPRGREARAGAAPKPLTRGGQVLGVEPLLRAPRTLAREVPYEPRREQLGQIREALQPVYAAILLVAVAAALVIQLS